MKNFITILILLICSVTQAGGPSYSGGSSSRPSSGGSSSGSSSRPSYSGGSKPSYSGGSSSKPSPSSPKPSIDSGYRKANQSEQSQRVYSESKTSYKTSAGQTRSVDTKDKEFENLKKTTTTTTYSAPREDRQRVVYERYYNYPQVVHYNDPYSTFFTLWLLDRSLDTQARWVYNHQGIETQQRIDDLYSKNAALRAKVKELEDKKEVKDPTYVPDGIDTDLMYDDDYVKAAKSSDSGISFGDVCAVFSTVVILCFFASIIYFIFFHKMNI